VTIYIDITQFIKKRAITGIQRVIKEYIYKALEAQLDIKILYFNNKVNSFELISNDEILKFLKNIKTYEFSNKIQIDIFNQPSADNIFFDMDAVWNSSLKRASLYKKLKNSNFKIFNFIYDLIPLLYPSFSYKRRVQNFTSFLRAVYRYSDFIFFDSISAQNDFLTLKEKFNIKKNHSTKVVYLGSDFISNPLQKSEKYKHLLSKKYILFVGTIELRKHQSKVLEAFETLTTKYSDLNLLFIGKEGWRVEAFIEKIRTHPLKDKKIFWLQDIEDNELANLYQNAFIVTYLSEYEGYGLPIAESLNFNNITITSNNSSLMEVGKDFADYVVDNNTEQIINIVSSYYEKSQMYKTKRAFIKSNYKSITWNDTFSSINMTISSF
jgi:glycosyltransferase involved in cell wall biosynthesis